MKRIATGREIESLLRSHNIRSAAIFVQDGSYMLPAETALPVLRQNWQSEVDRLKLTAALSRFDCENWSTGANWINQALFSVQREEESGLAMGTFDYVSVRGPHSINFVVHSADNGSLYLRFLEPQPSGGIVLAETRLTPNEIASCYKAEI